MARSARAVEAGKLRALQRDVARARAALRARMVKLRAAAKRYRASARRRVRAWYQAELAKLRAERARRYAEIGLTVKRRAAELKERAALARSLKRLDEHRRVLAALRAVRGDRAGRTAEARAEHTRRARELRETSREDVVREIEHHDPALLPVWEKVGSRIKATARKSRAEAFFEWVEANAEETIAIQAAAGDREAARVWKEQEAAARALADEKARRAKQREARRRAHLAARRRGTGRKRLRSRRAKALADLKVKLREDRLYGGIVEVRRGRALLGRWQYSHATHKLSAHLGGKAPLWGKDFLAAKAAAEGALRELAAVPF